MDLISAPSRSDVAAELPEARANVAVRPATSRSALTNNALKLAGVDGRSADARRYRDLLASFSYDCGGAASLTETHRQLVARAADLTMQAEKLQGAMIRGEDVDVVQQTAVTNALLKTLSRLGIRKRAAAKLSVPEFLARRDAARRAQGC